MPREVVRPLLRRAALDVPVVERQRSISVGGHDEANVGALLQRFGLVDDPA